MSGKREEILPLATKRLLRRRRGMEQTGRMEAVARGKEEAEEEEEVEVERERRVHKKNDICLY
jgi:hypothetical protein